MTDGFYTSVGSAHRVITRFRHADMSLVQVIEEEMLEIKNPITFDDIASLKTAKELLNEAVTLPLLIPEFFVGIREPWKGVLLFGPPGKHSTLSFGFGKPKTTRNESNRSQFIISLSLSLSVSLSLSLSLS